MMVCILLVKIASSCSHEEVKGGCIEVYDITSNGHRATHSLKKKRFCSSLHLSKSCTSQLAGEEICPSVCLSTYVLVLFSFMTNFKSTRN